MKPLFKYGFFICNTNFQHCKFQFANRMKESSDCILKKCMKKSQKEFRSSKLLNGNFSSSETNNEFYLEIFLPNGVAH